jgi:fibronectin type 3 domain-containing protein
MGMTKFVATLPDPTRVDVFQFHFVTETGERQLLKTITGATGSGIYEAEWDSTTVPDGHYSVAATALDADNNVIATGSHSFEVYNAVASGLAFQVKKPGGQPAAGARVYIYYAIDQTAPLTLLEEGRADRDGKYSLTGREATDGHQYFVVAQGSEPGFLYMQTLTAPANAVLTEQDTFPVTFAGRDAAGAPATLATIWATAQLGSRKLHLKDPLATLDGAGSATVYLPSAGFTFRQYSSDYSQYQVLRNALVTEAATVTIAPPAGGLATIDVVGNPQFARTTAVWTDLTDGLTLEGGDLPRRQVTPGSYELEVTGRWAGTYGGDSTTSITPALTVAAGETRNVSLGGPYTLQLATDWTGPVPTDAEVAFTAALVDQYGNRSKYVYPTLYVSGPTGSNQYAGWPEWEQWEHSLPGQYTVYAEVSNTLVGSALRSQPLTFQVVSGGNQSPGGGLTVNVIDRTGSPIMYGQVSLLKKSTAGSQLVDERMVYGGQPASFGLPALSPGESLALAVTGITASTDPAAPGMKPFFLVVPVPAGAAPITMQVDLRGYNFQSVTLQALDNAGSLIQDSVQYYGYFYGDDQTPVGALIDGAYGEPLTVLMPEGRYAFQAVVLGDRWSSVQNQYVLTAGPADLPANGQVTLGGSGQLTRLSAALAGQNDEVSMAAMAIFATGGPGLPGHQVSFDAPVYVTPGAYQLEWVLVRQALSGEWAYWLARTVQATGADQSFQVGSTFTVQATAGRPVYEPGSTLQVNTLIGDGFGNRLVRVALGFYGGGGFATVNGAVQVPETGDPSQIAPFLVIKDANGTEVHRQKVVDPDEQQIVTSWSGCYEGNTCPPLRLSDGPSSYFGQSLVVPAEWAGRQLTAHVEVGAGPEGPTRSVPFALSVSNAPILDSQPAATREAGLTITGFTEAGATVALTYTLDGGAPVAAGSATAGSDGRFSIYVEMAAEGTYAFTATATLPDKVSDPSQPLAVVVDRTAPAAPADLDWTSPDQNHIRLTWAAPGGDIISRYEIRRDGVKVGEVAADAALSFLEGNLEVNARYTYDVVAIDQAGNISEAATVKATTGSTADTEAPTAPTGLQAVLTDVTTAELTWEAADDNVEVVAYNIYRSADGAAAELIATVTDGLAYQDGDLSTDTAYTYTVTAVDLAGNESDASAPVTVKTEPMVIADLITRITPKSRAGAGLPGATVEMTLVGDAKRGAEMIIVYQTWLDATGVILDAPREVELVLPMAESAAAPGTYFATQTMPVDIAAILSVTGKLSDGKGKHVAEEATGLPLPFIGNMQVEIAAPAGATAEDVAVALKNAKLMIWSDSAQSGAQLAPTGVGVHFLEGMTPADDYTIRLVDYWSRELARVTGVRVDGGITRNIRVAPLLPASLQIEVLDASGAPLRGAYGLLQDSAGNTMRDWVTGADGKTYAMNWQWMDETIKVVPVTRLPFKPAAPQTIVLKPGTNRVTFQLERYAEGRVEGVVTETQLGIPMERAYVSATQVIDGQGLTRTAHTDENGRYSITLFEGPATINFSGAQPIKQVPPAAVTIPANGVAVHNQNVQLLAPGELTIDIYTRSNGGDWIGPIELNWRVAVHYGLSVIDKNGTRLYVGDFSPVRMAAAAGDPIKVCLDGRETGFPDVCQTGTFGADLKARVEVRLDSDALGRLQAYVNASQWSGVVYRIGDDGSRMPVGVVDQAQPMFRATAVGAYEVAVTTGDGRYGTGRTTVVMGGTVGAVVSLTAGSRFFGKTGNSLTTNRNEVMEGDLLHLRAGYKNNGLALKDAVLKLELPAGTTLVPETVTLDDVPVAYTLEDGAVRVALGDLAPGAEGVVRASVTVGEGLTQDYLAASAWIGQAGATTAELVGTSVVRLLRITVNAMKEVTSLETTVYGRAPVDSTVTVYANDTPVGSAIVLEGGNWMMPVTLPGSATLARTYSIKAEAKDQSGNLLAAAQTETTFDPNGVEVVTASVTGVHTVTVRPNAVPPRFPVVYIPGQRVGASLSFSDPSRITGLRMGVQGVGAPVGASLNTNGSFYASLPSSNRMGAIVASWGVKPRPYSQAVQPTLADMREMIPSSLYNSTLASFSETGDVASGPYTQSALLHAGGDANEPMEFGFSVSDVRPYKPTAEDQARIRSGAPAIYNPQFEFKGDTFTFTALVPASQAGGVAVNSVGAMIEDPAKEIQMFGRITGNVFGAVMALLSMDQQFRELTELSDIAAGCRGSAANYQAMIQDIANQVMVNLGYRSSMMLLSGVLAATGVGGPGAAVLAGFTFLSSGFLNFILGRRMDDLREMMANDPNCHAEFPVLDPVWIMDPGGYVYEATPENWLDGVTTTLYEKQPDGTFAVWDAAWYGQMNPLTTGTDGTYAWDVPEGDWQVHYQKDGYQEAKSPVLAVPPPRTDVNQGLVSLEAPEVASLRAGQDGAYVDVVFTQYMRAASLGNSTVSVLLPDGTRVEGNAEPLAPVAGDGGVLVTRVARFTPAEALSVGATYLVDVSDLVQNYAGRTLEQGFVQAVLIPEDATPPGAVTGVTAEGTDGRLVLRWSNPADVDFDRVRIEWLDQSVEVSGSSYTVERLENGVTYVVRLTAIDLAGNESAAVTVTGTPVDNVAPAAVTDVTVTAAAHRLTLLWNEPYASDLDYVLVAWEGGTRVVPAGIGALDLGDLADSLTLTFTLTLFDRAGNGSAPMVVSGTTPAVLIVAQVNAGPVNGLRSADGSVAVQVKANTFDWATTLRILRYNAPVKVGNPALTAISSAITVEVVSPLLKPLTVEVSYDKAALGKADHKKVALYRQDDLDPSNWVLVGGSVNPGQGYVRAEVTQPGTYMVMVAK